MQDLQGDGDDLWVPSVQGSLDWNNKLWDDWEDFGTTLLEHIKHSLDCKESVWVNLLSNTFEEDGEVVMVV